ncbi:hypothetical protein Amico_1127 [Aminobacterium colombiense DSM 12261]|uniref:Uncharacterized protein n=2 Tax=Aminobacterium TaxID=81466 RepID=D5EFB9_AMICL|nr:hypothetical protein Amico_1127 [Aminobacterium colombiense DSM 12261]
MNEVDKLAAIVELLVSYHPSGLMILLGERPPLSAQQWASLVQSIQAVPDIERVDASVNIDGFFNQVAVGDSIISFIEKLGSWDVVVEAVQSFRRIFPSDWNLFVEHIRFVSNPLASRLHDSMLCRIASKYGVDAKTVTRRRKLVPVTIAREAIGGFQIALFGDF